MSKKKKLEKGHSQFLPIGSPRSKQTAKTNISKKPNYKASQSLIGRDYLGVLLILTITLIAYRTVFNNGVVNWDDDRYIQDNTLIRSIDLKALFSTYVMGNYHPLTMMTYAIEYQIFGLSAAGYHSISILLHLINVFL